METSNFAHVIFQNMGKSYLPHAALECSYTLSQYIKPHPKDWVGIFKVSFVLVPVPLSSFTPPMFCSLFSLIIPNRRMLDSSTSVYLDNGRSVTRQQGKICWGVWNRVTDSVLDRFCPRHLLALIQEWGTWSMEGWCGCRILGWPHHQPITVAPQDWSWEPLLLINWWRGRPKNLPPQWLSKDLPLHPCSNTSFHHHFPFSCTYEKTLKNGKQLVDFLTS